MAKVIREGEYEELQMDNKGNVRMVVVPVIRLSKNEDGCAILARLRHEINYRIHNPTPGRPKQGRKRGWGANRKFKRGGSKKQEVKAKDGKK